MILHFYEKKEIQVQINIKIDAFVKNFNKLIFLQLTLTPQFLRHRKTSIYQTRKLKNVNICGFFA